MIGLVDLNGPVFLVEWEGGGDGLDILEIWAFRPTNLAHFSLNGLKTEHFEPVEIKHDNPLLSEAAEYEIYERVRDGKYYAIVDLNDMLYGDDEGRRMRMERRAEERVDRIRQEG